MQRAVIAGFAILTVIHVSTEAGRRRMRCFPVCPLVHVAPASASHSVAPTIDDAAALRIELAARDAQIAELERRLTREQEEGARERNAERDKGAAAAQAEMRAKEEAMAERLKARQAAAAEAIAKEKAIAARNEAEAAAQAEKAAKAQALAALEQERRLRQQAEAALAEARAEVARLKAAAE
jgi:hypothetical protein